jgi:NAD(P)H dehydrogenase (quinone)
MKIGITGATGQLGTLVVEQLKTKVASENIAALARSLDKASSLGVEAREFDYSKPEILEESLDGIEKLLLISSSEVGQRATQHANVINAAKKAGVKWIVYTSLLHADTSKISLAGEHLATEKALKESGIEHTILRNGWYSENYGMSIKGAVEGGGFIGSAGDGKISSASRADFAEAAATVISDESNKGKVFELAGDVAYTLTELAAEISKQTGKNIPYNNLPETEYAKILRSFGIPDLFADGLASWDVCASKGDLFDDSKQLSQLIGRPTTPISETVKVALQ